MPNPTPTITVLVAVPALDRLMDYLMAEQQAQIDRLTQLVQELTQNLQQHREQLSAVIQKEK